jgi:hypothetical protein
MNPWPKYVFILFLRSSVDLSHRTRKYMSIVTVIKQSVERSGHVFILFLRASADLSHSTRKYMSIVTVLEQSVERSGRSAAYLPDYGAMNGAELN